MQKGTVVNSTTDTL